MPGSLGSMRFVTTPDLPTTASTLLATVFTVSLALSQLRKTAKYTRASAPAESRPIFSDPVRRPIAPPMVSEPPTRARSNPVNAPSASSMMTQRIPPMTSSQFTQLPTGELLPRFRTADDSIGRIAIQRLRRNRVLEHDFG